MTPDRYQVRLTTLKSAERNGGGRGYLARLAPGPRGSVQRLFVRPRKATGGSRALETLAVPGDVFEARRWLWDANRQQYYGGTIWFGIQANGTVAMLTRDEAFRAVGAVAITGDTSPVDPNRAYRMVPGDLRCTAVGANDPARIGTCPA